MKQALFYNFTNKPFTGYWDGKPTTFKAGEKKYMEDWRAKHFAKHLVNQVLLEQGKENSTSPKFPEQVPDFFNLFNKACIVEADQDENQDASDLIHKQHEPSSNLPGNPAKVPTIVDNKEPQIIKGPDDDEDENFEGLNEK